MAITETAAHQRAESDFVLDKPGSKKGNDVAPVRSAKRATHNTRVQLAENRQHSDAPECIMSTEPPIESRPGSPRRGRLSAVGYALRNEL